MRNPVGQAIAGPVISPSSVYAEAYATAYGINVDNSSLTFSGDHNSITATATSGNAEANLRAYSKATGYAIYLFDVANATLAGMITSLYQLL